jgi:hypothetical protein
MTLTPIDELCKQLKQKNYKRVDELFVSGDLLEEYRHPHSLVIETREILHPQKHSPYSFAPLAFRWHTYRYANDRISKKHRSVFSIKFIAHIKRCAVCNCIIENSFCYGRTVYIKYFSRSKAKVFERTSNYTFYLCNEQCVEDAIRRMQDESVTLLNFVHNPKQLLKHSNKTLQVL